MICAFCRCFMLTSVHCQLEHSVLTITYSCLVMTMLILDHTDHKTLGKLPQYLTQYSVLFLPELKGQYVPDKGSPFCTATCSPSPFYCCSIQLHHHSSCTFVGRTPKITHTDRLRPFLRSGMCDHMYMVMYLVLGWKLRGGSTLASTESTNHLHFLWTMLPSMQCNASNL